MLVNLECVLNVSGVPDRIPVTLHRSRTRTRTRRPDRLTVNVNGYRFAVNVYGLPANDAAERHAPMRSALRLAGACPHPNRYRDRDRDRLCFRRTPDRIPVPLYPVSFFRCSAFDLRPTTFDALRWAFGVVSPPIVGQLPAENLAPPLER